MATTNYSCKKTLTSSQAASYISVSEYSLRASRMDCERGKLLLGVKPPAHIKIGRSVRYLVSTLDIWLSQFKEIGE